MRDFPAISTRPPGSSAGSADMSRSRELLAAQMLGAKYCSSRMDGDSSRTESLSS